MKLARLIPTTLCGFTCAVFLSICETPSIAQPAKPVAESASLRQFFTFEAPIFPPKEATTLVRLDLGLEVLERCQPDLSDLRVFDGLNREVPYRIANLPLQEESYEVVENLAAEITSAKRDRNAALAFEMYEVAVPKEVQEAPAGWVLSMKIGVRGFVREVLLSNVPLGEQVMAGAKVGTSVKDAVASSIFRLPKAGAERTFVPLAATVGRTLHVLLAAKMPLPARGLTMFEDPTATVALEPKFSFEKRKTTPSAPGLVAPLSQISRTDENGKTVIVFTRPSGLVPQTLRIATTTPVFHRKVEVFEDRDPIGQGTLFRLPAATRVETLDIPLHAPRQTSGPRSDMKKNIRVEITNEDSPALEEIRISAVSRQPTLVFALHGSGGSAPAGMLRLGGGRVRPPRYDLGALALDEDGSGRTIVALPKAELGTISPNDHFLAQSSLSSLMRPGIKVDARLYTKQRVLTFAPSLDGLNTIPLTPLDLAAMRPDMADLRVIDSEEQQWPFVLDPVGEDAWTDLVTKLDGTRKGASTYEVALPQKGMTFDRLEVSSATPFYDRHLVVLATNDVGSEYSIYDGTFVRRDQTPPLEIHVSHPRLATLSLVVRDGENRPLEKVTVRAHSVVPALFAIAPPGTYRMLMGYPSAPAPNYDIGNNRDLLAKVASAPAMTGPLADNPDFRERARLGAGEGPQHLLLWGALGLAVVVLAALTLRMVRREGEPGGSP